jgi:antitoxin component YwqK of YwqJK toxin-antitoxin module
MKKIFYLLLFSCLAIQFSHAQQADNYRQDTTTLYQRTKGFHSDPIRAKWRQELKQEGDSWILRLYNKKNILQEEITFADKNLEVRKGLYRLYQDGHKKEEGKYEKGYKVGLWKYYDSNQQTIERINYNWDKFHGLSFLYWDNGQVKASRNYVNGIKTGEWKMYYKDGKLALNEHYDENGKLDKGSYFTPSGDATTLEELMKTLNQ